MLCTVAVAQPKVKFRHLNTSDGLSQNRVTAIAEDYLGFIWLGTYDGLNRYDGSDFKTYRSELHSGINYHEIMSLTTTPDSTLWTGLRDGGLLRYNRQQDSFDQFVDKKGLSMEGKTVYMLHADYLGNLLIGYEDGQLAMLNPGQQLINWEIFQGEEVQGRISAVATDSTGMLWLGKKNGELWQAQYNRQTSYYTLKKQWQLPAYVTSLAIHENILWISTRKGMYFMDLHLGKIRSHEFLNNQMESPLISEIQVDSKGVLWIGASIMGCYRYDPATSDFMNFKESGRSGHSISSNGVISVYCDRKDNIWVGSYASGASLYNRKAHLFDHYLLVDEYEIPLKGTNVPSFAERADGSIWVANGGKLSLLSNENVIHYDDQEADSLQINGKNIQEIFEDSRGRIWIGTRNHGMQVWEKGKGSTSYQQLAPSMIEKIIEARNGSIYVIDHEGVLIFQEGMEPRELADEFPVLARDVNAIEQDLNGDLLLGTKKRGIYRYNEFSNEVEQLPLDQSLNIDDLLIDSSGKIWLGTIGLGLMQYDRATGKATAPQSDVAQPGNIIKSIEEDQEGNIWFSSTMGLSRFTPETGQLLNFTTDHGLQGDDFIDKSSMKTRDGRLLFGGYDGFNIFEPTSIQVSAQRHKAFITDVHFLNNQPKQASLQKGIHGLPVSMVVPWSQNDFTLSLASSGFAYKKKKELWYKLKGYRNDWVKLSGTNKITLTSLDPGNYELLVDTSLRPGLSDPVKVFSFRISPPFWRTPWAYALYAGIIAGLVFLFRIKTLANERLRADLRIKEIESEKIIELNRLKSSFFTNVSHEFRTPITLLMGPLESLMKAPELDDKMRYRYNLMYKNARMLLRLINQILDISKIEFGHMPLQVSRGNIIEHIRDIYSSFEFLADTHNIKYSFECNYQNLRAWFDKDKVEKITYNLLSNAFKFTRDGGEINLVLNLIPVKDKKGYANRLVMTVKDNGIGIKKNDIDLIFTSFYQADNLPRREHIGTGIGLSLTRQLTELHQGQISVNSEPEKGSLFTVEIPLNREHYTGFLSEEEEVKNPDRNLHLEFDEGNIDNPYQQNNYENYDQILIIDDNPDILEYLQIEMGNNYKIYQATDGETGFEMAIRNIPDLVISDIMMPGTDGYELCRKIKEDQRTSHVPVILISALSQSSDKIKGLSLGADDYITKPFNMALLQQRVENIIANSSRLRRIYEVENPKAGKIRYEDAFIQKVADAIEENIDKPELTVESLAGILNLTSMQLYRKIRGAADKSPNEFIRFTRLNRAAAILRANNKDKTVAEVAYMVGFNDPAYFSRCFKKQFQVPPSNFLNEKSSKRM